MADAVVKQTGSILHIRTFAEDLKRAEENSGVVRTEPQATEPAQPEHVPVIPMPKHAHATLDENTKKLQAELTRHAEPMVAPQQSIHADPIGHMARVNPENGAFDIRAVAADALEDATILEDRKAERPTAFDDMVNQAKVWWRRNVAPLFEDHSDTAEIRMDIAPNVQSPVWNVGTGSSPVPQVRTLAHDAEAVSEGRLPQVPPLPSSTWKRISEPRANAAVPHTSSEELASYKEALRSLPRPTTNTPQPPKKSFKSVRPIRPLVSATTELISKNTGYAVAPETDARERLARIKEAHTTALAPSGATPKPQSEMSTLPVPPAPRVSRDIPFIAPAMTEPVSAPIRTYRYDALSDVKERNLSAEKIAAEEAGRRERGGMSMSQVRSHEPGIMSRIVPVAVGLLLFFAIVAGGIFAFPRLFPEGPAEVVIAGVPAFFQPTVQVPVTFLPDRASLLQSLNAARLSTPLETGGYAHFYPTSPENSDVKAVATNDIMRTLDPRAPGAFVRALHPTLMFGAYGASREPFLILKITPFDTAFAGMLAWEEYLSIDLSPFFGGPVRRSYDPESLTVDQTRAAHFTDTVIQNHDVRVLYDEFGAERMLYTFAGNDTIIIARDSTTLEALLRTLQ